MEKDLEVVELFNQKHKGKSVMVFTDGSVYSGQVGCGACVAVLIPLSNEDDEHMASGVVGRSVDSTTCEIEGIVAYLVWRCQCNITKKEFRNGNRKLCIFCLTALRQLIWLFIALGF